MTDVCAHYFQKILKEIQVIVSCLSWDTENDPDILGMIGASFALASSHIPWNGPLSAVRVGKVDGNFIINPNYAERAQGTMDLTLAALERDGKILINMVEMGAKEVSETDVLEAMQFAEKTLHDIIHFQQEIVKKIGKPKVEFVAAVDLEIAKDLKEFLGERLDNALTNAPAGEKNMGEADVLKAECVAMIKEKYPDQGKEKQVLYFFEKETEHILIRNILEKINDQTAELQKKFGNYGVKLQYFHALMEAEYFTADLLKFYLF